MPKELLVPLREMWHSMRHGGIILTLNETSGVSVPELLHRPDFFCNVEYLRNIPVKFGKNLGIYD